MTRIIGLNRLKKKTIARRARKQEVLVEVCFSGLDNERTIVVKTDQAGPGGRRGVGVIMWVKQFN